MSEFVEIEKETMDSDEGHFPYGTSLELEDELVESLGLTEMKTGDSVLIRATAIIKSKNERSDDDNDEVKKRVCLQLTGIQVASDKSGKAVSELYGEDD